MSATIRSKDEALPWRFIPGKFSVVDAKGRAVAFDARVLRRIVAAVNVCERLAPGVPPEELEARVRQVVKAACKEHGRLFEEPAANGCRFCAALRPFGHLLETQ